MRFPALLLALVLTALLVASASADEAPGLEDALAGFDEIEAPAATAGADDAPSLDDLLSGFDEIETRDVAGPDGQGAYSGALRLSGELTFSAAYGYRRDAPKPGQADYRGLSRMRAGARLRLDYVHTDQWAARVEGTAEYDFAYANNGLAQYADAVLDEQMSDLRAGEAYVRWTPDTVFDLTVGRQIVVWGKSDLIRVTDILNPMDGREPGMVDVADLREAVCMSRAGLYSGPWALSLIALHEFEPNRTPAPGSDFAPASMPALPVDEPSADEGHAASLSGFFSGWDLSLYAAALHSRALYIEAGQMRYARIRMAGAAANWAVGAWLIKAEAAYLDGVRFKAVPGEEKARMDVLAGMEYTGIDETSLVVEAAVRHTFEYVAVMAAMPDGAVRDEVTLAARATRDFMNETVHLTGVAMAYGDGAVGAGGWMHRVQLVWDVRDALKLTVGAVNYYAGNMPRYGGLADRDRVFTDLAYSF